MRLARHKMRQLPCTRLSAGVLWGSEGPLVPLQVVCRQLLRCTPCELASEMCEGVLVYKPWAAPAMPVALHAKALCEVLA